MIKEEGGWGEGGGMMQKGKKKQDEDLYKEGK